MRRVLVTGANGFVGTRLCSTLIDSGYEVRGAVRVRGIGHRQVINVPGEGVRQRDVETNFIDDVANAASWVGVLPEIDAIVHLAARVHVMHDKETNRLKEFRRINSAGTECLARQAAKAGVRRFVYVSSVKVNGERTFETPFRELDEPRPEDAYALSKWEAEQALQRVSDETGLEIVIVRPPLVYGPGVKGNFLSLLRLVKSGVPLPLASVNNRRSFVSLDNLIALIVTCLEHPRAAGEVFLAADGEDLSTPELIRCIARSMGKTDRLFRFPAALLQAASRVVGKKAVWERLCGSLAVDASKAKKVLGWEPVSSVDEAMNKMTRWYVESQADRRIADASVSGK